MTKKISVFLSVLCHPLLMTTLVISVILFGVPEMVGVISITLRWYIIGLFFVMTVLMPVINIIILRYSSNISDFALEDKRERTLPYLFTTIFYGTTAWVIVYQLDFGNYLSIIFLSVFLVLLLTMLINFFWKISAHAAGVWGATGVLFALYLRSSDNFLFWVVIAAVLLSGAVSSARLYLGAHNPSQVYAGGLLGFIICFVPVWFIIGV